MRNKYNLMPVKQFDNIMDNVFNRSISDILGNDFVTTQPSVNIIEEKDAYIIHLAAPGMEKSDFSIKREKDQLIISALKENKEEESQGSFTRKEFNYSSFKRSFTLDQTIDANKIEAEYKNGILTVMLFKKEEAKENSPLVIEIK